MDTAEIDRELSDLETRIDRLRALYEQYFLGIEKMEPSIPRRDAERKIQVLRKEQIRNTAQRFKFQMLVQRYNTMQQHWARVTREIENGTYRRDVMRAAARFGEKEALTITGKKRQKQYAVLAEAQTLARNKRRPGEDDAPEFADSDLLVDDDSPPSRVASPPPIAPIAPKETESTERKEPLGGLRWAAKSPVDPATAARSTEGQTGVKRRLAELAASMKGAAPQPSDETSTPQPRLRPPPVLSTGARTQAAGAGSLDLDLDESAGSPRSSAMRKPGAPSAPLGGSAIPGAAAVRAPNPALKPGATALRPSTPSDTSGPRTPAPQASSSPRASTADLGALDNPFPGPPAATLPRKPLSPAAASSPRAQAPAQPAPRPPSAVTPAPRATPIPAEPAAPRAPAPPAAADGTLPDQRMRQIYTKYVEAKRSANESTAGVTYEKLAETLRAQADRLKVSHPAKSIDYDVVIKDGKTLLKPVLR
ncbi:MAG: MXAN_5187 C-terminal domain-containing protein [Byssovorax sp.]